MISRITSREIPLKRYLTVTPRTTGIPKLHFGMTSSATRGVWHATHGPWGPKLLDTTKQLILHYYLWEE